MVNLFRLLGLPDPSKVQNHPSKAKVVSVDPGPQAEDKFHDLGEARGPSVPAGLLPEPIAKSST